MVRLPKGKCALYWENLLLAVLGDQFMAASQYICGVVVSIRNRSIDVYPYNYIFPIILFYTIVAILFLKAQITCKKYVLEDLVGVVV